ncbi:unnamed protein product [Adineta steineri]|uniref:Uncharacterized protein n=1 Tax=Adineta steineri TaxID=433720 RepID=A0A815BID4_9BILA|nr:unnamed protein product [Adineta steineri]CAF1555687.1 unnamed protein product [Adineta steineri]
MGDVTEEKLPLLNIIDGDLERDNLLYSRTIHLRVPSPISHCHVPDDKFDYSTRNRLVIVLIVCIIFIIIEIIGGVISNSTAIGTDAAHMCIDAAGFLISLTALYLTAKRPTDKLSYGYIRAEVLGAFLSVLTIWLATGILVYMAIQRCIDQTFEVKPVSMIVVASCGVVFNILMFFILHVNTCNVSMPHGHSHDNKSSSSVENTHEQPKSSNNINIRAATIHVIGDFIQSIGVLFAAILINVKPEYKLADPICTFIFSILVLITTVTIMRDIVLVLMEGVPSNVNYKQVVDDLVQISGVRNAHSLHIWSLSTQKIALSVHIAIDNDQDPLKILSEAQKMLRNKHSITRSTIQVETYNEHIMNSCENCQQLGTK